MRFFLSVRLRLMPGRISRDRQLDNEIHEIAVSLQALTTTLCYPKSLLRVKLASSLFLLRVR
jgi:hypothetical protein